MAKIRKDNYGITLEQMKQYFIKHQHAREIGDKKMMEKIEYHLTTSISTMNAACWPPGSMLNSRRSSKLVRHLAIERKLETNMDNITRRAICGNQVTFLMEDRGFAKMCLPQLRKPTRYYNRIFENYNRRSRHMVFRQALDLWEVTAVSARKRRSLVGWPIKEALRKRRKR